MKTREEILAILKSLKCEMSERYHVVSIGVFGSVSRGEQKEGSDIDILVEFSQPVGFFTFLELEELPQFFAWIQSGSCNPGCPETSDDQSGFTPKLLMSERGKDNPQFLLRIYSFQSNVISTYTSGMTTENEILGRDTDQCIRNLEILGEAAKNIPESFKDKYPEVPGRESQV